MDNAKYIAVISDAFLKLENLYQDRQSIDGEIIKVERLIAATANMLPDEPKDLALRRIAVLQELYRLTEVGLTDAIRSVLKAAYGDWLTVTNVRDRLNKAGFDFSTYSSNPLASISAILRRMKPEEIESTVADGGVAAYRWKNTKQLIQFMKAAAKAMDEKKR
jgi:hypothetical protein